MDRNQSALVEYFARRANRYESVYRAFDRPGFIWSLRSWRWYPMVWTFRRTISLVQRSKPARVLEIGCGNGVYTERLARDGILVTALDICEEMIQISRLRLDRSRTRARVELVHARFPDWEAPNDRTYDLALAIGVIDYLEEPQKFLLALRHFAQAAVITFPARTLLVRLAQRQYTRKGIRGFCYTRSEICGLLAEAGWRILSMSYAFPGTFRVHVGRAGAGERGADSIAPLEKVTQS